MKCGWDKYVFESSSMSAEVLNRCNGFPFKCVLIVGVRLGPCCIELHYGTILEDTIASIIGCFEVAQGTGSNYPETIPQCNSTQDQLSLTRTLNWPVLGIRVFYLSGVSKDNTFWILILILSREKLNFCRLCFLPLVLCTHQKIRQCIDRN